MVVVNTYTGLVQLLFVRKHPIADKFKRWATEKDKTISFLLNSIVDKDAIIEKLTTKIY